MSDENGHHWQTRSRHRTSDGIVSYQSCHCGMWRLLPGTARPSALATRAAGRTFVVGRRSGVVLRPATGPDEPPRVLRAVLNFRSRLPRRRR
ncbi:hypothetical protein C6361_13020 [Plantactinospora sp. BC1]|nr:hypothetical protein C6361_13020 [Plantactinospora sp. BC1]